MRNRILLVLALMCGLAAGTEALIWSQPDGQAHPYVGLVVFDVGGVPSHRCSGTLLSPTVLLTAGHCTDGTSAARVWFDSQLTDVAYPFSGGTAVDGTPHTHPDYDGFATFPNTSDVGIVVLDAAVNVGAHGTLAAVGALDSLPRRRGQSNQLFTLVGYGDQAIVPFPLSLLVRYRATPQLVELGSANTGGFNIHLSSNPGQHAPGGACFGDSGGPALIANSNVVAGVGSFVLNQNCTGAAFYYRIDTAHARNFIVGFLQ